MTGNEYQEQALRTANKRLSWADMLADGAMGLAGEAGECVDLIKKHLFQGHGLDHEKLKEELGDVMWYLALIAASMCLTLDSVMAANIDKLRARYPEGFSEERSMEREA